MQADILEDFIEVSYRATGGRMSMSAAERAYFERKAARVEAKQAWHSANPRPEYKARKQVEREVQDIVIRLRRGERPKKWGKRWRAAAESMGIEVPKRAA